MRVRLPLACAAVVTLAGCAALRPPAPTEVPVSVPCVTRAQVPPRPPLTTPATWQSLDAFERARALLVDRARLLAHAAALELLITACVE